MKNSADLGGCYPPRPSASVDNTFLDLQNSSYPTQPHSIIANTYPAKRNGLKGSNFLTWTGVRCALSCHLRIRSREVNKDHVRSLQFKIGDKTFDPALSKSRDFYGLLI